MTRNGPHQGRRLPRILAGCVSVLGAAAFGANLTVNVDNIQDNKGAVRVFVYEAANWLDRDPDNFAGSQSVDITERKDDGPLAIEIELEPGEYAAFAYHDLNANNRLDKKLIRVPKEPYAFSGQFSERRLPRFEECMFVVGDEGATIMVGLQE